MTDGYVWVRRANETNPAYGAFQTYLNLGPSRSLARVEETLGKSKQTICDWSSRHDWVERTLAYDRFIATADTDGMVHEMAAMRDKNLALMDKLRRLLDMRLDDFIARRDDPTIRWTQACVAMTKIEANSLALGAQDKGSEKIETIMAMLDKVTELQNRVPEES